MQQSPPHATARRLGPNGVLFYVIFYPAGATQARERLLPLQLRHAAVTGSFEGMPPVGSTRRLLARVGAYDIDVLVFFGARSRRPAWSRQPLSSSGAWSCRPVRPRCR